MYLSPHLLEPDEASVLSEDEVTFVRDAVYRAELLSLLKVDDIDNVAPAMDALYATLTSEHQTNPWTAWSSRLFPDNVKSGFVLLFSYNLFYLTHACLFDQEHGQITEENERKMNDAIILFT
jgi:hypothetical protein